MDQPRRSLRSRPLHLTIVSDNRETLDRLQAYLRRAGVQTNGMTSVEDLANRTPRTAAVVLLFPDDFSADSVAVALAALRWQRPKILPVLVTSAPRRFELLPVTRGGIAPLVVPKPIWGWTILDAIHARLEFEIPGREAPR